MKKLILLIEDEPAIAETIKYSLSTEGFDHQWANTGETGLKKLKEDKIDLIILDLGLPDINGFDLLKEVRKNYTIPVLILTAREHEIDKVLGLELGADDYIVKPFSPRELTARIKAILRRTNENITKSNESHNRIFVFDNNKRQVLYFGNKLELTRYEYEIMNLLYGKPGWVFSRDKIMDMIWVEPEESYDRTVDAHIKTIRAKLMEIKPDFDPIITHRGIGYSIRDDI